MALHWSVSVSTNAAPWRYYGAWHVANSAPRSSTEPGGFLCVRGRAERVATRVGPGASGLCTAVAAPVHTQTVTRAQAPSALRGPRIGMPLAAQLPQGECADVIHWRTIWEYYHPTCRVFTEKAWSTTALFGFEELFLLLHCCPTLVVSSTYLLIKYEMMFCEMSF